VVGYNESSEADCICSEYADNVGCIVNCPVDFSQVWIGTVCKLGLLGRDDYIGVQYMPTKEQIEQIRNGNDRPIPLRMTFYERFSKLISRKDIDAIHNREKRERIQGLRREHEMLLK
jgi:hypothetical protein